MPRPKYIKLLLLLIVTLVALGTIFNIRRVKISQSPTVENLPAIVVATIPSQNTDTQSLYPKLASGDYSFSFATDDSRTRTYRVHVPLNYDASKKYPVLLGLHGGFGTAEAFEKSSNFSILADERGYIAVYGQGISFSPRQYAPVWNAGGCCGQAQAGKENIDDVGYVRAVVEQVATKYNVDSNRIFVTGMSNGGMLTNRLACEASDIFAGAAVVSGTIQISSCSPSKKMPILLIHGTKDQNVPYDGGKGEKAINPSTYISVEQELRDWGERNGCSGAIITTLVIVPTGGDKTVDKLTFSNCTVPTVLYRINGGAHEWPGADININPLEQASPYQVQDASRVILDFLGL